MDKNNVPIPFNFKKESWSITIDPKVFPLCHIKEHKVGWLKRRYIYVHKTKDAWEILILCLGKSIRWEMYKIKLDESSS